MGTLIIIGIIVAAGWVWGKKDSVVHATVTVDPSGVRIATVNNQGDGPAIYVDSAANPAPGQGSNQDQ